MAKRKLNLPKSVSAINKMGNRSWIASLMVIVTLVVSVSVVLSRLWLGDIKFNAKVMSAKNQVNDVLSQNVNALPQLQQNYNTLLQNGVKPSDVLAALPVDAAYADFSNDVEAMAALAGLQLTDVSPSLTSSGQSFTSSPITSPTSVSFNITANGSYKAIQAFLHNVEAAKRPVRVNQIIMTGQEPSIQLQMTATTYYQSLSSVASSTREIKQ